MVERGWRQIGPDAGLAAWAAAALPAAQAVLARSAEPWRCGGTWFVGVDALPNDAEGGIGGVELPWPVLGLAPEPLHRAQLSVIRPGYPQLSAEESAAAFAFRRDRDAAHLDGLIADADKRRRIAEPHGWILGLPLNAASRDAAPLVVWEGSHLILRAALVAALAPWPRQDWEKVDITDAYVAARRRCFAECRRVELPVVPGMATLMHRHLLHGVAPWGRTATAAPEGRIIAYFRPQLASVAEWIAAP